MTTSKFRKPTWLTWTNVTIVCVIVALLAVVWALVANLSTTYRAGYFHMRRRPGLGRTSSTQPITPAEIQPWMTFDYINFVFRLPPDYLRSKLDIANPRYPHVQLSRAASEQHIATAEFVSSVQKAVEDFQAGK